MISAEYQGKGYGKMALLKLIELIKTFPCGEAKAVELSYNHENTAARNLFLSAGFVETGENDGDGCVIAKLIL
jgi:diamine N-acetyltransferase